MFQNVFTLSSQNIKYDDNFYNMIYNSGKYAQSPAAVLPPDINLLPNDNFRSNIGNKKTEIVYTNFLKKQKKPKDSS